MTAMSRLLAVALAATLLLAACNDSGDDSNTDDPSPSSSPGASGSVARCDSEVVHTPIEDPVLPVIISMDLAVGENRFVLGLIDQASQQPLTDAEVHLQFLCFDTEEGTPAFEVDLEPVTLTKNYTHTHADGVVERHEAGQTGVYVADVNFDRAGGWGIVVTGQTADGRIVGPVRPTFGVNERPNGLAVGDPAPRTEQPIVSDENSIETLDSSEVPNPAQHNMTIAQAVTSGKPTVVAFVTPAFCQSQICGPIKDIFDELNAAYEGQANFVHIEPYDVAKMRAGECESLANCLAPAVTEWKLETEPWVYIVGADGNVAARFDGIASYEELDEALQQTLTS
jgi:hypothetical protein